MNNIYFENGWLYAQFEINGKNYELSNSNMFNNDVIEKTLYIILSFMRNDSCKEYVVWNQESQYYVIEYELINWELEINLYCCRRPYFNEINCKYNEIDFIENERKNLWEWAEDTFFKIYENYENRNKDEYFSEKANNIIKKLRHIFITH